MTRIGHTYVNVHKKNASLENSLKSVNIILSGGRARISCFPIVGNTPCKITGVCAICVVTNTKSRWLVKQKDFVHRHLVYRLNLQSPKSSVVLSNCPQQQCTINMLDHPWRDKGLSLQFIQNFRKYTVNNFIHGWILYVDTTSLFFPKEGSTTGSSLQEHDSKLVYTVILTILWIPLDWRVVPQFSGEYNILTFYNCPNSYYRR